MINDAEQQLYKDIADLTKKVPKLQNEIKALKGRLTKLSNRVESLELMTFQDQISRLGEKIDSVSMNLVNVSRLFASFVIDVNQMHIKSAIDQTLKSPIRETVKEQITLKQAQAAEAISHSLNPLEIAKGFRYTCVEYSHKYNLDAFIG